MDDGHRERYAVSRCLRTRHRRCSLSRADVRFFNRTLPCGAKVIGTETAANGFFIVTFRLTERPGRGSCGSGTGQTARAAFRVRDELITDWLRVQDVDSAPSTPS